jgi:YD repeat-containing protein
VSWEWRPENWMWQLVNNSQPSLFFDKAFASSWYAQHGAANLQSGNLFWEGVGELQLLTGGVISPPVWASGVLGVASMFSPPIAAFATAQAVSSSLASLGRVSLGGAAVSMPEFLNNALGLFGSWAGERSMLNTQALYSTAIDHSGQMVWNFAEAAKHNMIGSLSTAAKVLQWSSNAASSPDIARAGGQILHNVGGILFDRCADLLTEIGELDGAYWDADGRLVLVGRDAAGEKTASPLPGIDRDHFLVALRAAVAGHPLGVSIDPPSEYRDGMRRGVTPPDRTPMLVSYLGHCEGTLFGAILFEADRLLKCLDKGIHNQTRKPVRASVAGFRTLLELMRPNREHVQKWSRFWFVIDRVELRHDSTAKALTFGDVRLKVLTETEKEAGGKDEPLGAEANAFARHLTDHYDEYAREFPILARLKELAKIASVAKLLANQMGLFDYSALFGQRPLPAETPRSTPGISVIGPNTETTRHGDVTITHSVSLFGGVDMDPEPFVTLDRNGAAQDLRSKSEAASPGGDSGSWTFPNRGQTRRAVGFESGQAGAPFHWSCPDHRFVSTAADSPFALRRVYNSKSFESGQLGPGWTLWTPFSLLIVPSNGKREEVLTASERGFQSSAPGVLVLCDSTAGGSSLYRCVTKQNVGDAVVFGRVVSQVVKQGGVSFKYDPADVIRQDGDRYELAREKYTYIFNGGGQLREVQSQHKCVALYDWKAEFLSRIEDGMGRWYSITQDKYHPQRVGVVLCSDGTEFQYEYGENGCLSAVRGAGVAEVYAYDEKRRLAEVRDGSGRVFGRAVYADDAGNVATTNCSVSNGAAGKLTGRIDNGRLAEVRDEVGGIARFEYGLAGELNRVIVSDSGRTWRIGYDQLGRLSSFEDSMRRVTDFGYGRDGGLQNAVLPGGRTIATRMADLHPASPHFVRSGPLILRAHMPEGSVAVSPRWNTMSILRYKRNEFWEKRVFDRGFRMVRWESAGVRSELREGPEGSAWRIRTPAGTVTLSRGPDEESVKIEF